MDLIIWYWDEALDEATTHYFDSKFLGRCGGSEMKEQFDNTLQNVETSRMVQVSMDGPKVN